MADKRPRVRADFLKDPWRFSHRLSLTTRILAVNILPLALLGGGIFYLDSYRKQLLSERYKLARIEAQITAEALAGATRERQETVLTQIGKEQHMRLRMFNPQGRLTADSFALDKPAFDLARIADEDWQDKFAAGSTVRSTRSSVPSRSRTTSSPTPPRPTPGPSCAGRARNA